MSKQSSALVRSNLGRNSALAAIGSLSPNVINAIAKMASMAIDRINGGERVRLVQGPQPQQRRQRNRQRRARGGNTPVPQQIRGTGLSELRRTLKVVYTVGTDTVGAFAYKFHLARGAVTSGSVGLLSDGQLGVQMSNLLKAFTAVKVHSVKATFKNAAPDSMTMTCALGWTTDPNYVTPTTFDGFTSLPAFTIGARDETVTLTGVPKGVHNGTIQTNTTGIDDAYDLSVGSILALINSGVSTRVGVFLFEIEVTLSNN